MKTKTFIVFVLILLFFSSIEYFTQDVQSDSKTYINKVYKFQLNYPSNLKLSGGEKIYKLKSNTAQSNFKLYEAIGTDEDFWLEDKSKFEYSFKIFSVNEWMKNLKDAAEKPIKKDDEFISLIWFVAKSFILADGCGSGSYLADPVFVKDFRSRYGMRVIKFYATAVSEDYEAMTKEKSKAGPYYVVQLSQNYFLFMNFSLELASKEVEATYELVLNFISPYSKN
ncbi:MAG: hypothetical protein WC879_05635 [Melioribacteraceae bacterium]